MNTVTLELYKGVSIMNEPCRYNYINGNRTGAEPASIENSILIRFS